MPSANLRTAPRRVKARSNELKALLMRQEGFTYLEIGKKLGMTDMGAYKCIMRVLNRIAKTTSEEAEKVKQIELRRLDGMLTKLKRRIDKGDPMAIQTALRIQERRAKYLALDSPQKLEHSGQVGIRQYVGVPVEDV